MNLLFTSLQNTTRWIRHVLGFLAKCIKWRHNIEVRTFILWNVLKDFGEICCLVSKLNIARQILFCCMSVNYKLYFISNPDLILSDFSWTIRTKIDFWNKNYTSSLKWVFFSDSIQIYTWRNPWPGICNAPMWNYRFPSAINEPHVSSLGNTCTAV